MTRAGILGAVNAVTETGDDFTRSALGLHIGGRMFRRAYLLRHFHHVFGGTAVVTRWR